MKAPAFWFNPPERPGWQSRLLAPLGWAYARATRTRLRQPGWRPEVPVICLGNLVVGGSGKTPATIALAQMLSEGGAAVHVVSRGHGGRLAGPLRVDPRRHAAAEVGDEPLLIAAFAPCWTARDRAAGVRAAEAAGAQVVLMDDGLQNPSVVTSAAVVVVDAGTGFGNGRCLPAGPLREPVPAGLARADCVLAVGEPPAQAAFRARWGAALGSLPVFTARLAPLETGMTWQGLRAFAFAGIARPQRFFDTLAELGVEVVGFQPLDDHQPIGAALFSRLDHEARALGAQLVTTEKDAVRLPPDLRAKVLTLPVRLMIDDPERFLATLRLGLAAG